MSDNGKRRIAKRQIAISSAAVFGLVIVLAGIKFFQIRKAMAEQFQPPPEAVTITTVIEVEWPRTLRAVGSLKPVQGSELKAEEAGRVSQVHVESGAEVAAGAALVELDTAVEESELRGALAHVDQAKLAFERATSLRKQNATSAANYETAQWNLRDATAKADALKARIARKKITAPFAGRTGVRMVNIGDYVNPGTPVIPLQALNALYADFSLPERNVPLLKSTQAVEIVVDAYPGKSWRGRVEAVNPEVDANTRNVKVRALVDNPGGELRSGMFSEIELTLAERDRFPVVPASSIVYAPYGDSVYMLEENPAGGGTMVRQQIVKIGPRRGDLVAILQGLKADERVVSSGGFKLRPGIAVSVNNSVAPSNDPNPKPADT